MSSSPAMPVSSTEPAAARYGEDIDSACSTPFVSAPSSPGHGGAPPSGYFFSAPASPMHFLLSNNMSSSSEYEPVFLSSESGSFEFEFSSRFSPKGNGPPMTSADELFCNGQIRPMKLSSHLERPHEEEVGTDLEAEDAVEVAGMKTRGRDLWVKGHAKYSHRKTRSMSPMRANKYNVNYDWQALEISGDDNNKRQENADEGITKENESSAETTPSSSRSSSSGRNSKKWIFLKDLLHRSKSEGNKQERFWSAISFSSPAKKKKTTTTSSQHPTSLSPSSSRDEKKGVNNNDEGAEKVVKTTVNGKPANGVWRRKLSAHEMHYTANRAQSEEMKKKTFLPYRQGLLGCLGFSSKSYGAFSGFTKNLSPISSR